MALHNEHFFLKLTHVTSEIYCILEMEARLSSPEHCKHQSYPMDMLHLSEGALHGPLLDWYVPQGTDYNGPSGHTHTYPMPFASSLTPVGMAEYTLLLLSPAIVCLNDQQQQRTEV